MRLHLLVRVPGHPALWAPACTTWWKRPLWRIFGCAVVGALSLPKPTCKACLTKLRAKAG